MEKISEQNSGKAKYKNVQKSLRVDRFRHSILLGFYSKKQSDWIPVAWVENYKDAQRLINNSFCLFLFETYAKVRVFLFKNKSLLNKDLN